MISRVRTENSLWLVDTSDKTWKRVENNGDVSPYPLRTNSGTYLKVSDPVIGQRLHLLCEPFVEGASARFILTSPILNFTTE